MQEDECAYGISGDLRGDGMVASQVETVVAGHAAIWILNAGLQEPLPGAADLRQQTDSVTKWPLPPSWRKLRTTCTNLHNIGRVNPGRREISRQAG